MVICNLNRSCCISIIFAAEVPYVELLHSSPNLNDKAKTTLFVFFALKYILLICSINDFRSKNLFKRSVMCGVLLVLLQLRIAFG